MPLKAKETGILSCNLEKVSEFTRRISIDEESGCWNWTGSISNGYGRFRINPRTVSTHRVMYELCHGFSENFANNVLDHLCENKRCVNLEHLKLCSNTENVMRADGFCAVNARKTHCPQGHEFTTDNIWVTWSGKQCLKCKRAADRAYKKRLLRNPEWVKRHNIVQRERYWRKRNTKLDNLLAKTEYEGGRDE